MPSFIIPVFIGLFAIFHFASAAPPRPSPNLLRLFSPNVTSPYLRNFTAGHEDEFPPEEDLPDPDEDAYFHPIPDTDITIAFSSWGREGRPAWEAELALGAAADACMANFHDALVPGRRHRWASGSTVLELDPQPRYGDSKKPMTWGTLLHVIFVFQRWLQVYPGLYFGFELYESVETEEKEMDYAIGAGQLTVWDD